jgi:hypothetical protein
LIAAGGLIGGACGGSAGNQTGVGRAGASSGGGAGASAGAAGMPGGGGAGATDTSGASAGAGTGSGAGTGASTGSAGGASGSADSGGSTAGASGGSGGSGGATGATDGGAEAAGAGGSALDGAAGPSFLPAGYTGTPFTALTIPGRINACDYDQGGAGVAWCHNTGACASGTTTGDYPSGAPPYRPPIPANAPLCSGAACADNVGVCRMNPQKPDLTAPNVHAPATDTYLCYSVAGEWTKYTVVVEQAGTYAVGGFMAVPMGGGVNISFSGPGNVSTGNLTLAVTNPSMCGGGEYYHCWAQRDDLATVTFTQAGTYLMTLTQTGRFNADNFTFTKM